MPFTEHLRELRNRLMISCITVGVLAALLFWPSKFIILWMKDEYLGKGIQLHAFAPTDVLFTEFPAGHAFKATIPRAVSSGDVGDTDVYGAQQHAPLLEVDIPLPEAAAR